MQPGGERAEPCTFLIEECGEEWLSPATPGDQASCPPQCLVQAPTPTAALGFWAHPAILLAPSRCWLAVLGKGPVVPLCPGAAPPWRLLMGTPPPCSLSPPPHPVRSPRCCVDPNITHPPCVDSIIQAL